VEAEPVKLNSVLGTYTNFMNLLDYSALAMPAGRYLGKLPWGITIFADAWMDRALLELGGNYENVISRNVPSVSTDGFDEIEVVVCGAHLNGMALNWQLTDRGGRLVSCGKTLPCYRMYLVPAGGGLPERPALVRVDVGGVQIETETWALSTEAFGDFVSKIPGPLGIGKVLLEDGRSVPGFIAEPIAAIGAKDISGFGGWRSWVERA
jgi:allophanate hydrolase